MEPHKYGSAGRAGGSSLRSIRANVQCAFIYIHKAIREFMKIFEAFSLGAMAAASLKVPASDNARSMYIQLPTEFKSEGLGERSVHSLQALRKAGTHIVRRR